MEKPTNFRLFPFCCFLSLLSLAASLWGQSTSGDSGNNPSPKSADSSDQPSPGTDQASPVTTGGDTLTQWADRIKISGFTNAGYVKTGTDGAEPDGHFYAGERLFGAGIFLDAQVDPNISVYNELFLYNQAVTMKDLYVQFKDPFGTGNLLNFRVGRIDLPYGDEYLWDYPMDNPMILRTAEWIWGFSQGVLVYGHSGALGWQASITDGLAAPALDHDDSTDKSLNAKLTFNPERWLHFALSGMDGGNHAASNLVLNSVNIAPVGTLQNGVTLSTLGASPSAMVDFQAWQGDARIQLGHLRLMGDFGMVYIDDVDPFARTLAYYFGEAKLDLTREFYLCARYSSIGTFNPNEGYMFGGDYDNATNFGYDVESLSRVGAAIGYKLGKNTLWKAEVDDDMITLIGPAVGKDPNPGTSRYTLATEVDVRF
jgi:hypothetical protein